jgi:predicted transcriptional regulator
LKGSALPQEIATEFGLTRSNAYKVLDRLVEVGLINKHKINKKTTYQPNNPLALSGMVNEARNKVALQEDAVKSIMDDLLKQFYQKTEIPTIEIKTGKLNVVSAYKQQISLKQPIYFIRSSLDIPTLGFETMHEIRTLPSYNNQKRFGITALLPDSAKMPEMDKRSNLERIWIDPEDYAAPVEWSVSGSMLLIVLFAEEPHAISITNPIIAEAFLQIWKLINSSLKMLKINSKT